MPRRLVFLALPLLASLSGPATASAGGGVLPDGAYRCEVYMLGMFIYLGEIVIKGDVYSGPSIVGGMQQGYNYQISPRGEISWLGPLGGYTAGGNSVSLTQVTADGQHDASFDIILRQPNGSFTASTCTIGGTAGKL
ncbi:MAG TPA: hypothetical protein VGM46_01250 [Mesorhizobium sp.]